MIKLAIVDDHELFLQGLESILNKQPELDVVETFSNGATLLENIDCLEIDILLLDVQLQDITPRNLLKEIRAKRSGLPILYLTMLRGSRIIRQLEKESIQGYVLKDIPLENLIKAIEEVAKGKTYFSDEIYFLQKGIQTNTVTHPKNQLQELLGKREYEILELICKEMSNAEIAKKLFLSVGTVDTHRKNIILKLGVNNTVGLVKFAIQNGILSSD
ncbi:response regulator transcription factor [Jiulongibacter sp. NS-SX5]|uniref:response regulator transcription factor n=1 Tax=Jiulongibacter sp. NS-SX5 TaxID=3463854 RepID=UPI0040597618